MLLSLSRWSVPASVLGAVLLVAQKALSFALPAQDASDPWAIYYDPFLFVVYNLLLGAALLLFVVGLAGLHARRAERHDWLGRMGLFLASGAGALVAVSIVATFMVGLWPFWSVWLVWFTQLLAILCLVAGLVLWGLAAMRAAAPSRAWISGVQWREVLLILAAGSGAALLSHAAEWIMNEEIWGLSGTHWLHVVLTIPAAAWVALEVGTTPVLYGVLVGLFSGIANQVFNHALLDWTRGSAITLTADEVWKILILSVVAGLLGGIAVQVWPARPEQEALHQVSSAISLASSPQGIVDAIGERFADPRVSHVALWQDVFSEAEDGVEEVALQAVWIPRAARIWGHGGWQPGLRLDESRVPSLANLEWQSPLVLRMRKLPASERAVWEYQGIRSVLLLPLIAPSGARVGLLMVTSRTTYGFPRGTVRTYRTIGALVAPALENMRLRATRRTKDLVGEAASGWRDAGQPQGGLMDRAKDPREESQGTAGP